MALSICVVAITTAISNTSDGLTAGSYALGLTAVALAVLTFLKWANSVVLRVLLYESWR
jgi:hypothetical protein